jgi:hypothetical protein
MNLLDKTSLCLIKKHQREHKKQTKKIQTKSFQSAMPPVSLPPTQLIRNLDMYKCCRNK